MVRRIHEADGVLCRGAAVDADLPARHHSHDVLPDHHDCLVWYQEVARARHPDSPPALPHHRLPAVQPQPLQPAPGHHQQQDCC